MTEPLVTIGIPFYNSAETLLDAVRSIFAQTYTNWELILVSDGSTDGSEKLAQRIRDPRVRVIENKERRFIAHRLNQIIQEARGSYIARMDADDFSIPERIEKQVSFLHRNSVFDGCGTGLFNTTNDLQLVGVRFPEGFRHEEICRSPLSCIKIMHATYMARTDWYRKNKYDEDIDQAEDCGLWLKSYKHSRFANLSELLYIYRGVDTLSIKRQLRGTNSLAKVLLKYGVSSAPKIKVWSKVVGLYIKFVGYATLTPMGIAQRISGRYGSTATAENHRQFHDLISKIMAVNLPLALENEGGKANV